MKKEIWKNIVGFENYYEVSSLGRVRSIKRPRCKGQILKPGINHKGYFIVYLSKNSKKTTCTVHRLVARTFLGESELQVNHKNGNKEDNQVSNLEWCTTKENIRHAWATGLQKKQYGQELPWTKLNEDIVREIRASKLARSKLAKLYGISHYTVGDIQRFKTWRQVV